MQKKNLTIPIAVLTLLAVLISVTFVSAAVEVDTSELREAVTVDGVREHQEAFQDIADANDGTRVAGSSGYNESAEYVAQRMEDAGYNVTVQPFDFAFFEVVNQAFSQTSPNAQAYDPFDFSTGVGDFDVMTHSGSGVVVDTAVVPTNDVIIPFPPTPNTSTSGCEAEDFVDGSGDSLVEGQVALIQRGSCDFVVKAQNAQDAGAVAALVFNEGQADAGRDGIVFGTLGQPQVTIPVLGISYALGVEFYEATDPRVSLNIETISEIRSTVNILAETPGGRGDRVVVVGAHLDSVPEGPGIQDNGSGSAAILEIAEAMAELEIEPRNKVRFAWWGAEEFNLLGSQFYVNTLGKREIKNIAVNLNFDMIGSPNFVPFVYDGDGSDTPLAGPNGSKNIEAVFLEYFAEEIPQYPPVATAFDGRSDYGPFIAVGIPAGGLFTGAEGIKSDEEASIYGGIAGEQYDQCYHAPCDTYDNISEEALDFNSDAAAHAVLTFAETTSSVNGTDKGKGNGKWEDGMEYRGSDLKK